MILRMFFFFTCIIICLFICSCEKDNDNEITGGITGIVIDKETGEPICGANLTLSPTGLSKISGSDGRYEFQEIPAQQYTVQGQSLGYEYNRKLIVVPPNQTAKCDLHLMPK